MDNLKKVRTTKRAIFTKTYNALVAGCERPVVDEEVVNLNLTQLERTYAELENHNQKILDIMMDADCLEEELVTEM